MIAQSPDSNSLPLLLRRLKLPSFLATYEQTAQTAESEGWSFARYLHHLVETELSDRERRKIARNLTRSRLPSEKTLETLDLERFPRQVKTQIPSLCEGAFVSRAENVLAFGLPGRGKTHVLCAIGHELVRSGFRVLFTPAFRLVQHLLASKKNLEFDRALRRLDAFDAVIIDDIGYVQQSRDEMEVLFTFLAERYERRSVMITSNLVFSEWDKIFKDAMTTAAAIDRVVHHSVILEMTGTSYRSEKAHERHQDEPKPDTEE